MVAEQTSPQLFVLEAIDPGTECVVMEAKLQVRELAELLGILEPDTAAAVVAGAGCDLDRSELENLMARFKPSFEPGTLAVRLRPGCRHDDLPYLVHTGRELALMLEGRKPLAVFSGVYPAVPDREDIPERLFDSHVVAGTFVKRERIFPPTQAAESVGKRRPETRMVLYALPQHEWRIEAYLLLRDTAAKAGWNEGFERMEGSLLGYTDWQNDIFIEQVYRHGSRSGRAS